MAMPELIDLGGYRGPVLSRAGARELDRRAIALGLPLLVLMENAARAVADVAMQMADERAGVLVVCGKGNNGADGLAGARMLSNAGRRVVIASGVVEDGMAGEEGAFATQWRIVSGMGLERVGASEAAIGDAVGVGLVIDAIAGTGLTAALRPEAAAWVRGMNRLRAGAGVKVLSVDVPSGMDADTGSASGVVVMPDVTVTFGGVKLGMMRGRCEGVPDGDERGVDVGEVYLGHLGVPVSMVEACAVPRY